MAGRLRLIAWLAGLGVLCGGGAAILVAQIHIDVPKPQTCQAPQYQERLISAYLADPVMQAATYGATPPPSSPPVGVQRYCNNVGAEHFQPVRSIGVFTSVPVSDQRDWYPMPMLFDRLDPLLTRLGWHYGGYGEDLASAQLSYCKAIAGQPAVVSIWLGGPRVDLLTGPLTAAATELRIGVHQAGPTGCPTPPVSGGTVDHSTRQPTPGSTPDAYNRPDTGPVPRRWNVNIDAPLGTSTAADGDAVYIGTGGWDSDNYVYALDAATGGLRWRTRVPGEIEGRLVVRDGRVYAGTTLGLLLALDAGSGAERWRTYVPFGRRATIPGPELDVAGGMVFVPGVDGRVYAVDAATGTLRWRSAPTFGLSPYGADSPVAAGTVVCAVGDDRALYGLDSATGTPRWRLLPDGGVIGPLTAIDTTVYAASVDGLIHAVDAQSGRQQWTGAGGTLVAGAPPAAGGPLVAAAPPAAGGLVIVGGPALASGVDRTSGTVRWRTYGSDPLTAGPTSGLLYVTIEESLYALDPGTGRPVWVAYVRNLALGVPVTGTAAVFVAGNYGAGSSGNYLGGTLYAFDAPGSG